MKMIRKCAALALMAASGFAPMAARAQSSDEKAPSTTKGPYYEHSENEMRSRKLMRGIANVGLCVAEIPNQAFQEAYKTSPITGAVVGACKGVVKGAKRFGIGLWEIATFYAPINNYEPYVEPEVVFMEYQH